MSGSDVIVVAPWIVFGAGLSVICLLLLRSRCQARRRPPPSEALGPQGSAGPSGAGGGILREPDQTAACDRHGSPRL